MSRLESLRALVEQSPENSRFRFMLCMELLGTGDPAGAVREFDELVRTDPSHRRSARRERTVRGARYARLTGVSVLSEAALPSEIEKSAIEQLPGSLQALKHERHCASLSL